MKKIYLLGLALTMGSMLHAQTTVIEDNFDSYNLGGLNNGHWKNWYLTDPDDALDIIVTDQRASSPTKSGYIGVANENKGQDAILVMPSIYNNGTVTTEWKMYVPADSVAYYNMQATGTPGESYAFECTINGYTADDTLMGGVPLSNKLVWTFTNEDNNRVVFGYAPLQTDQWITVKQVIDLSNSKLNIFVGGNEITYYYYKTDADAGDVYPATSDKAVAAFDFYSLPDTSNNNGFHSTYYLDDVKITYQSGTGISNVEKNSNLVALYPNPAKDQITIAIKDEKITGIEVFNIKGQRVLNAAPNSTSAELNTRSLAAGVYTAKVRTKSGTFSKEFVVKR